MIKQILRDLSQLSTINKFMYFTPSTAFILFLAAEEYFCVPFFNESDNNIYIPTLVAIAISSAVIRLNKADTLKKASSKTFGFGTYYLSIFTLLAVLTSIQIVFLLIIYRLITFFIIAPCSPFN